MFFFPTTLIDPLLLLSIIGNEEQMSAYELHIGVKDYCFGRDDQLIGVSVMQLKDIMDQVLYNCVPSRSNLFFRARVLVGSPSVGGSTWTRLGGPS